MSGKQSQAVKVILSAIAFLAFFYPITVWFQNTNLNLDAILTTDIFPVFGLTAFSLMWLHIVGGAFKPKLEPYINFQKFVSQTSVIVLILLIFHPLLLLVGLMPNQIIRLFTTGKPIYLWLGVSAWVIFIAYDIAKKFQAHRLLAKHWQTVKFISTLAFFPAWIHSLAIGGDLQRGLLRYIWIFYGITAALAAFSTYIYRGYLQKSSS